MRTRTAWGGRFLFFYSRGLGLEWVSIFFHPPSLPFLFCFSHSNFYDPFIMSQSQQTPSDIDNDDATPDQEFKLLAFLDAEELLIDLGAEKMRKYRNLYSFAAASIFRTPFPAAPPFCHTANFKHLCENAISMLGHCAPRDPSIPTYEEAFSALAWKEERISTYTPQLREISRDIKTHKSTQTQQLAQNTIADYTNTINGITSAYNSVVRSISGLGDVRGKAEKLLLKVGGALIQSAANAFFVGPITNIASNYLLTDVASIISGETIDVTGKSALLVDKTKVPDIGSGTLKTVVQEGVGGVLVDSMGWVTGSAASSVKGACQNRLSRLMNGVSTAHKAVESKEALTLLQTNLLQSLTNELLELNFSPSGTACSFHAQKTHSAHGWPFFCMVGHYILQHHPALLAVVQDGKIKTTKDWPQTICEVTKNLTRLLFTKKFKYKKMHIPATYEALYIKIFWALYFAGLKDEPSLNNKYSAHSALMLDLYNANVIVTRVERSTYKAALDHINKSDPKFAPTKVIHPKNPNEVVMSRFNTKNKRRIQDTLRQNHMLVAAKKSGTMGKTTMRNLIEWGIAVKRSLENAKALPHLSLLDTNTLELILNTPFKPASVVRSNAVDNITEWD